MERLNNLPANRKPKTGVLAELLALRPLRVEALEHALELALGDAGSVILNADLDHVARLPSAERDLSPGRSERLGVRDKVPKHLDKPPLYSPHDQTVPGRVEVHPCSDRGVGRVTDLF